MNQTPTSSLNRLELTYFCTRLGKILFNISILFLIFCVCGILSFISVALIMLVGFLIILANLGTIFIINPNFWNNLMSAVDISSNVSSFFMNNFYIFAGLLVGFAVLSLILLSRDKTQKHTGRITTSIILIVISVISIVINFSRGM